MTGRLRTINDPKRKREERAEREEKERKMQAEREEREEKMRDERDKWLLNVFQPLPRTSTPQPS